MLAVALSAAHESDSKTVRPALAAQTSSPSARGVDLEALMATSRWLGERLGKELPAMVTRAGDFAAATRATKE